MSERQVARYGVPVQLRGVRTGFSFCTFYLYVCMTYAMMIIDAAGCIFMIFHGLCLFFFFSFRR